MILETQDLYELYEGGEKVLRNERFFRKLFEESREEYLDRLNWASYPNYQKKIVNTHLSYVFHGQVVINKSEPLPMEQIARKLGKHSFIGGEAYALETEGVVKVYDKRQVSCRDGLYVVGSGASQVIIDLKNMKITGRKVQTDAEPVTEDLKPDRFVVCRWDEEGESLIADTAMMNLQIYNYRSIMDSHFNRSLWYLLYGPGLRNGQSKPKPRTYIPVNKDEQTPGVVTIDSPATDKVRQEMKDLKTDMAISVGLEQEFSDNIKVESGASRAIKMLDTNAIVSSGAFQIQDAVNRISAYHAKEYKHEVQTITLNPLLKVTTKEEEYQKYKFLLESCGTDEVSKAVQIAALKQCLADEIDDKQMDLLVKDIMKNGGRKLYESASYVAH